MTSRENEAREWLWHANEVKHDHNTRKLSARLPCHSRTQRNVNFRGLENPFGAESYTREHRGKGKYDGARCPRYHDAMLLGHECIRLESTDIQPQPQPSGPRHAILTPKQQTQSDRVQPNLPRVASLNSVYMARTEIARGRSATATPSIDDCRISGAVQHGQIANRKPYSQMPT